MYKLSLLLGLLIIIACKTPQAGVTTKENKQEEEIPKDITKIEPIEIKEIPSEGVNKNMLETPAQILGADMPTSIKTGQAFNYLIRYETSNGCQQYSRLKKETTGNNTKIQLILKEPKDAMCTDVMGQGQKTVPFQANEAGEYYFYFYRNDKLLISRKLMVVD